MSEPRFIAFLDLKSPYSYLAVEPLYALAMETGVPLDVRPYPIDIAGNTAAMDESSRARWLRRIKYLYQDVRRWAAPRGITIRGPKKVYDSTTGCLGMLWAKRQGKLRGYLDVAFPRFFTHALEVDDLTQVAALLAECGIDTDGFDAFCAGSGRDELAAIVGDAERRGVFGVPSVLVDGELFWGQDRLDFVRCKLQAG